LSRSILFWSEAPFWPRCRQTIFQILALQRLLCLVNNLLFAYSCLFSIFVFFTCASCSCVLQCLILFCYIPFFYLMFSLYILRLIQKYPGRFIFVNWYIAFIFFSCQLCNTLRFINHLISTNVSSFSFHVWSQSYVLYTSYCLIAVLYRTQLIFRGL
jgi:hypothetical protein